MIPIKGKTYLINCAGPYEYNRWVGKATYLGTVQPDPDPAQIIYDFLTVEDNPQKLGFFDEDIFIEIDLNKN